MKAILLLLGLTFFSSTHLFSQTETEAPTLYLDVTVNGKTHQVKDGGTLSIDGNEITVKTSDILTFDYGLLQFNYPTFYAFEFEEDLASKMWTLDGNYFVVVYFEMIIDFELEELVSEIAEGFGRENCTISDFTFTIDDKEHEGKRIRVNLLGEQLTYDMVKLNSQDEKSHFISFQDTKNFNGTDSEESIETMKMIQNTIRYSTP
ncbi:MAG: hypothetical protein KTR13_06545 [Saprospiraceae bacterium]|nr:hypothetical protein [Saprospiraceae bacterium]